MRLSPAQLRVLTGVSEQQVYFRVNPKHRDGGYAIHIGTSRCTQQTKKLVALGLITRGAWHDEKIGSWQYALTVFGQIELEKRK